MESKQSIVQLSVIIPAFNEETNLRNKVLDEVVNYLKAVDYSYEVIIVDDGSLDNTVGLINEKIRGKKNFQLIKNEHQGKAVAVMTGLLASKGSIALFADMDQATPLKEVEKFFPKFEQGYDVVIGSRSGRKGAPMIRKLSAWGFSFLRNLILGLPFRDTQCGFKAFNKKAVEVIFPRLLKSWNKKQVIGGAVNASFDIETLYIAKKNKLKIAEVPVTWHYVGTERVQLINDAYEAVTDMLRIKFSDLKSL